MLFIIRLRLHAGSRLICSAQVESEKMDDVAFILDDQNCGAACRFHWQFAFIAQNASDRKE
jgi:hypothetical protein